MQSGDGMTMQEAEQEIKYYQEIFQVVRLLIARKRKECPKMCRMDVRAIVSGRKIARVKIAVPIKRYGKRSRRLNWNSLKQKSIR